MIEFKKSFTEREITLENEKQIKKIRENLDFQQSVIPFNNIFYPTKGVQGHSEGYFIINYELVSEVKTWVNERLPFSAIIGRYKALSKPQTISEVWPDHYPTYFGSSTGNLASGENIFLFFPEALGIKGKREKDYFGFEFIDVWYNVFEEIVFPCMRVTFDRASQIFLYKDLRKNLEKTIYLASVFHEIGHRVGLWRVSPTQHTGLDLSSYYMDTIGELWTDTLLVLFLKEFPEIHSFLLLQRLFWFGRFGHDKDQIEGCLNEDNDCWIGSYLWRKFLNKGCIVPETHGKWHLNPEKIGETFASVLHDLKNLSNAITPLLGLSRNLQDNVAKDWMMQHLGNQKGRFTFPESLRMVFDQCRENNVPYKPTYKFLKTSI